MDRKLALLKLRDLAASRVGNVREALWQDEQATFGACGGRCLAPLAPFMADTGLGRQILAPFRDLRSWWWLLFFAWCQIARISNPGREDNGECAGTPTRISPAQERTLSSARKLSKEAACRLKSTCLELPARLPKNKRILSGSHAPVK